MKPERKYFSKEYKLKAVGLCQQRENINSVAKELGLRADMLSRWKREYSQDQTKAFIGGGNSKKNNGQNVVVILRKKLREAEMERDILKKAVSIFSKNDRLDINL